MIFSSDLTFSVDVPGRSPATGRVTGDGAHLTVEASDPVSVWAGAVGSGTGTTLVRLVADQLAEQGATVSLTGPGGRVASLGAGIDSLVGRVATGSRRVSLGRPGAVAPLARAQAGRLVQAHRGVLAAGGLAVVGAVALLVGYSTREHADS